MAQTVGYPCAIAAHLVLEGQITQPGKLEWFELLLTDRSVLLVRGFDSLDIKYFSLKFLGMVTPLAKEIYKPILSELEKLGITARRTVSTQY